MSMTCVIMFFFVLLFICNKDTVDEFKISPLFPGDVCVQYCDVIVGTSAISLPPPDDWMSGVTVTDQRHFYLLVEQVDLKVLSSIK